MVVADLLRYNVPPVVIAAVLLTLWHGKLCTTQDLDFTEIFSGGGAVTRGMWDVGLDGSALDSDYTASMDLTTPAGFLLALVQVLRCKPGGFVLIALVRRSFSIMWLLEQPSGTCLANMPWFQKLWSAVEAFRTTFWMGNFGHPTPKQHLVWSNDHVLLQEINNRAGYMSREAQSAKEVKLVRKYIDKQGVKRHVGIRDQLKSSQRYPDEFGVWLAQKIQDRTGVSLPDARQPAHIDRCFTDAELFMDKCTCVVDSTLAPIGLSGDLCKQAAMEDVIDYLLKSSSINFPGIWFDIFKTMYPNMRTAFNTDAI